MIPSIPRRQQMKLKKIAVTTYQIGDKDSIFILLKKTAPFQKSKIGV